MGKFSLKNVAGIGLAPFTGGLSLLATDYAKKAWKDFSGQTAQEKANAANIAEAEKNRQWQEKMSNTAITRQMQDMLNAGINPNLAGVAGGASTPGGAQAQVNPVPSTAQTAAQIGGTMASVGSGFSSLANGLKSLTENKYIGDKAKAEIANTVSNTALTQAQTAGTQASTVKTNAETQVAREQAKQLKIDNITREDMNRIEIALKKSQNAEVQQKVIAQAIVNAYNKTFGTNPEMSWAERAGAIAIDLFYKFPRKGIDWAINESIKQIQK